MLALLVYTGLLAAVTGLVSIIKPLRFVYIRSRRGGAAVLLAGSVLGVIGAMWPARLHHAEGGSYRIDEVMPDYHFNEFHSIRVNAPPEVTFGAIKAVTPEEIRFLRTLLWIRNVPERLLGSGRLRALMPGYAVKSYDQKDARVYEFLLDNARAERKRVEGKGTSIRYEVEDGKAPASAIQIIQAYEDAILKLRGSLVSRDDCCTATLRIDTHGAMVWIEVAADRDGRSYRLTIVEEGDLRLAETRPILDLLIRSGFVLLTEETNREIVVGTVNRYWKLADAGPPPQVTNPQEFKAFDDGGYVKVTCDFHVEDEGDGWSRVTTETRILATDASARRKFAVYWRLIYPGSALIRRMWLRAIKWRAEHGETMTPL